MAVYYCNYLLFGLNPWTYHASVIVLHIANAGLVFLLSRRVLSPSPTVVPASLAAGLFLLFGGHAEAVTWIGGMADPLVTLFLLAGVLAFTAALSSSRPLPFVGCVWVTFGCALLAKESAAVFPALALATLTMRPRWWQNRVTLMRTGAALVPLAAISGLYLVLRHHALGLWLVTLEGLGTGPSLGLNVRAFFIRCFLPQGDLLVRAFVHHLDLLLGLVVLLGAAAGVVYARWRPITCLAIWLGIALAPVLPLSIGIMSTDSERLIYLPSVFGCILTVELLERMMARRWLWTLATLMLSGWHLAALRGHNEAWIAAAGATLGQTRTYGQILREHSANQQPVFILNIIDNVSSAFVWRRGFHEALRVTNPDLEGAVARTIVVSVMNAADRSTDVVARRDDAGRTFTVHLVNGSIVAAPTTPYVRTVGVSPSSFTVVFTPIAGRALILYSTVQRFVSAGDLPSSGLPFGYIDTPAGSVNCGTTAPALEGWALDDDGISTIALTVQKSQASIDAVELGNASRVLRPDVTAALPYFPDSSRPGWSLPVPCNQLRAMTNGAPVELIVTAVNSRGARSSLGTRTVLFSN